MGKASHFAKGFYNPENCCKIRSLPKCEMNHMLSGSLSELLNGSLRCVAEYSVVEFANFASSNGEQDNIR